MLQSRNLINSPRWSSTANQSFKFVWKRIEEHPSLQFTTRSNWSECVSSCWNQVVIVCEHKQLVFSPLDEWMRIGFLNGARGQSGGVFTPIETHSLGECILVRNDPIKTSSFPWQGPSNEIECTLLFQWEHAYIWARWFVKFCWWWRNLDLVGGLWNQFHHCHNYSSDYCCWWTLHLVLFWHFNVFPLVVEMIDVLGRTINLKSSFILETFVFPKCQNNPNVPRTKTRIFQWKSIIFSKWKSYVP